MTTTKITDVDIEVEAVKEQHGLCCKGCVGETSNTMCAALPECGPIENERDYDVIFIVKAITKTL